MAPLCDKGLCLTAGGSEAPAHGGGRALPGGAGQKDAVEIGGSLVAPDNQGAVK